MDYRLNLLALTSTGRRSPQFHPLSNAEVLKLEFNYSLHKTLCLVENYVKVRSSDYHNVLCELYCNLIFKCSVWLIGWNCCERLPVDGSASKFRRFVVLYLTILHAAKYFQVNIYLVEVLMYSKIRFFYRIL